MTPGRPKKMPPIERPAPRPEDGAQACEAAARVQEERYRVLVEDVADGFYEVDLGGNFRFFNDALCRIFGYPREAIHGRNYRDFMDAENAQRAFDAFNRLYREGGGVADIAWEILNPAGERRYLEISAKLIVDEKGQSEGFRGIARDVTDRHLAQQALKESEQCALDLSTLSRRAEQRYRAFLDFLPDPVFVFNLDSTVSYLNPAFEKVFGWTLKEVRGKILPFVPEDLRAQTREGIARLFREKTIHGFETQRLTRDGRRLDMLIDGAIFYDETNQPAGQVITLRDVTREKRNARVNQALFRIAKALYQFRSLDARLEFITQEVRELLGVEGAMVILLDEEKQEFFFREAVFDDSETGKRMKELRFPIDKGVAGEVLRTGKPLIVPDTAQSPHYFAQVDEKASYQTRSMLDVPLETPAGIIGVLCAVNKKSGPFNDDDVQLLGTIANIVALPIENAAINEELDRSFHEVKRLNRAKDRVIHHLSHELKTPLSVLAASLNLFAKQLSEVGDERRWQGAVERAQRNLQRMLDLQYKIEDMLQEKDVDTKRMLSLLLDQCSDELQALAAEEFGEDGITERLRRRIDWLFGPRDAKPERIHPARFVAEYLKMLRPAFAHRQVRLETHLAETPPVCVPADVLGKVIEGLVRNAVENTPDGGEIRVSVGAADGGGVELDVRDTGTGMPEEMQRLITDHYFTAYDPLQYSTRRPYDFKAGGKGFDLLRMQIFAERYHFKIRIRSTPCPFIHTAADDCPGSEALCPHVADPAQCRTAGGTIVSVWFPEAATAEGNPAGEASCSADLTAGPEPENDRNPT
jgi:PAS domain S-box-containing protein